MLPRKHITEDPSIKKWNKDRNKAAMESFRWGLFGCGLIFGFFATPFLFLSIPTTILAWLAISFICGLLAHHRARETYEEKYPCPTAPIVGTAIPTTTPSVSPQASDQTYHQIFLAHKTADKSTQTVSEIGTQTISESSTQTTSEIGTQTPQNLRLVLHLK